MTTLINEIFEISYKVLDPIHDLEHRDYKEAYNRLCELMGKVIDFSKSQGIVSKSDDDKVAITLLCLKEKNFTEPNFLQEYSKCELYAMHALCNDLLDTKRHEDAKRYESLMLDIIGDIQCVIARYEKYHAKDKENIPKRKITVGRRASIDLNDRREVIKSMFWLEQVPDISKLSVRDIRPHAQIIIRQALEMIFKQIIGYADILNKTGQRDRKSTQVGCEFILSYKEKQPANTCVACGNGWSLKMPIPIKTIEMLNTWCNSFTHDPWIVGIHIQHFVYSQYERIVNGCLTEPKFEISDVDKMRAEFEIYIAEKKGGAIVRWPEDKSYGDISRVDEMRKHALQNEIANLEKALKERKDALSKLSSSCCFLRRLFGR